MADLKRKPPSQHASDAQKTKKRAKLTSANPGKKPKSAKGSAVGKDGKHAAARRSVRPGGAATASTRGLNASKKGASKSRDSSRSKKVASGEAQADPGAPKVTDEKKDKRASKNKLIHEAVQLWEELRPRTTDSGVRNKLVDQFMELAKGSLKALSMNHASARVVQFVVKNGSEADRRAVWSECKDHVLELAQSNYGSFVLKKLIHVMKKDELREIVRAVKGKAVALFRHARSAPVIADLCVLVSAESRNAVAAEFYSREFGLMTAAPPFSSLLDAWQDFDGPKRRGMLQHMQLSLMPIIEKGIVDAPLVHRLVNEFMTLAPTDVVRDCVEALSGEPVLHMVHTHDGARVGCLVAAYGSAKQRKKLVKAIKGHVLKMCLDEFAYVPLIKVLSCVDDTELLRKCVVQELAENIQEVCNSKHGCKVVLSMLRESARHLPPHAVKLMDVPVRIAPVQQPAVDVGEGANEDQASKQALHTGVADSEHSMGSEPVDALDTSDACDSSGSVDEGCEAAGNSPQTAEHDEFPASGEDAETVPSTGKTVHNVLGLSKKPSSMRRAELWGADGFGLALLRHCALTAANMLQSQQSADIVLEVCCGEVGNLIEGKSHDDFVHALSDVVKALNSTVDKCAQPSKPAVKAARIEKHCDGEAQEFLIEHYVASRAVCRVIEGDCGAAGTVFMQCVWDVIFAGRSEHWVKTHAAKVLAALAAKAPSDGLKAAMDAELGKVVGDVSQWIQELRPRKLGK